MDPAQPTYQVIKKSFFETNKGRLVLATASAVVLFVILIAVLSYKDIINLSSPFKKPSSLATSTPVKITLSDNFGFKAGELTLDCPVESSFCASRKLAETDNKVVYKAASSSGVLNPLSVATLENIAVSVNEQTGKKYFYESTVSKDGQSCYTVSYALPLDAEFGDLLSLTTLQKDAKIATLGSQTFQIEGEEANVLIQVRNTPMDPGAPCSLLKKAPEFFESFH